MYALKLGILLKSVAAFLFCPNGESKLPGACVPAVAVLCVACLRCESGEDVMRELEATRDVFEDLGRACRVHCFAADAAACVTGRIVMVVRREGSVWWVWKLRCRDEVVKVRNLDFWQLQFMWFDWLR